MKKRLKAISPLIATILLVVVAVILVTIILSFGKSITTKSLDKTKSIQELSVSDAGAFIYPKSFSDGVLQINYQPPSSIQDEVVITGYKILEVVDMEPVTLATPFTLVNNSLNILQLDCLYEYNVAEPEMNIQLITSNNTYINVKQRDSGMVCSSGGTGTLADPIIICDAEDLNNMRNDLDANYSLGKDIDLQCFSRRDVNGWSPVGNISHNGIIDTEFYGSLNGNNHSINNLYIYRPGQSYIGFFGELDSATVENLQLKDVNVTGSNITSYTGALCGHMYRSEVDNCSATGTIIGAWDVGGLIGGSEATVIRGSVITNCSFVGTIYSGGEVGGLIGSIFDTTFTNNYAASDIYVGNSTWAIGGLIGDIGSASVSNCYSTGNIYVGNSSDSVGGFSGYAYDSNITNSYSNNLVSVGTAPTNLGGFLGYDDGGMIIQNSYWDINSSGQLTSDGNETGKTTTEMKTQSTFTDWDFSTIWAIDSSKNNGYPYLRWQN